MDAKHVMIRLGAVSKKSPAEILDRSRAFFGESGAGMRVEAQSPTAVRFTGAGGFVQIQVTPHEDGTEVDIQARQWEYDARKFMEEL